MTPQAELVLGIDLGSSYFKLGLFDRRGILRGLGRVPAGGEREGLACELPCDGFWSALRDGLGQALAQADAAPGDIQAVAYASQANSFCLLDEDDRPLTPLILWRDERAQEPDEAIARLWARDDFLPVTGLGIEVAVGFAVVTLAWLRRLRPDVWSRTRRIMTISDYLTFSLTGRPAGDQGTASLLGLWDLPGGKWWDRALEAAGVSAGQLSSPQRPGTVAGGVTKAGADLLGLPAGLPLVVGSLDHHVAAVGAGIGQAARFSESTGTVLACLRISDRYEPKSNCCMGPAVAPGEYYQLAFSNNGAGALEWYQQRHAAGRSITELTALAEAVPAGCDGLVALPECNRYAGLEGFADRTNSHQHGHFARAIMESTAATLTVLVDHLCPEGRPRRIVTTGGGARSDLWLQIKADLLGVEFVRTNCQEPACMGAGMLAAIASGWFADLQEAGGAWTSIDRLFAPGGP